MIHLNLPFEMLKEEGKELPDNMFCGLAATYGNDLDDWGDLIRLERGCFKKTISENRGRIKVMYRHHELIGKPTKMEDRKEGLYVEARVSATATGKDVITLLTDEVLSEISVGFDIVKFKVETLKPITRPSGYSYSPRRRTVTEAKLWEFSPVPHGRNPKAKIFHERLDDEANRMFQAFQEMVERQQHTEDEPTRVTPPQLLELFIRTMSEEQRMSKDMQTMLKTLCHTEAAPPDNPTEALSIDAVKQHLDTLSEWEARL